MRPRLSLGLERTPNDLENSLLILARLRGREAGTNSASTPRFQGDVSLSLPLLPGINPSGHILKAQCSSIPSSLFGPPLARLPSFSRLEPKVEPFAKGGPRKTRLKDRFWCQFRLQHRCSQVFDIPSVCDYTRTDPFSFRPHRVEALWPSLFFVCNPLPPGPFTEQDFGPKQQLSAGAGPGRPAVCPSHVSPPCHLSASASRASAKALVQAAAGPRHTSVRA